MYLWHAAASLSIAMILTFAIWISVPSELHNAECQVNPNKVRFFQSAVNQQIRRPLTGEAETYLLDQFKVTQKGTRQFSFFRHSDDLKNQIQRIFIPISGGDISLSVNGAPAAQGTNLTYFGPGFGQQYLYAEIQPFLFNPGQNRIDILMRQDPAHAGIRKIYFCDDENLAKSETTLLSWAYELKSASRIAGIIGLVCSFFGLIIGYHRFIFVGGAGLGGISTLYGSNMDLFNTTQFLWGNPGVLAMLVSINIVLIFVGCLRRFTVRKFFLTGCALAALMAAILGLFLAFLPTHIEASLLVVNYANKALLPVLLFGIPLQLILDARLFRQNYAAAQVEIRHQKEVISAQDKALENEIKQKAVMEERQRFTRDMHDGIGGQLMSLLVRVRSGRVDLPGVEDDLQSSLTDLRMVVDSLDNVGQDLSAAMATFHSRASKQLEADGVNLDWKQHFDLSKYIFNTRQTLNLYRLLQEAITNIIRHAEASHVRIEFSKLPNSDDFRIQISDDGKGFDVGQISAGKGLKNMRERARKIGSVLEINTGLGKAGTTISLVIPAGKMDV